MRNLLPLLLLSMMVATKGMAQGVIDVHSHIITPEFLSACSTSSFLQHANASHPYSLQQSGQSPLMMRLAEWA